MPNTSSVPTVKNTLKTLLAARVALSGVQLTWAYPGIDKIARESLFFDRTELSEVSGQLGNQRRHETYTQYMYVCVKKETNDVQVVEQRAWTLVGEIEQQLRTDASLALTPANGVQSVVVQFAGAESECYQQDQGWSCEIRVALNVQARI